MNYLGIKFREKDGVLFISTPSQYILCDMFMRIQEFYESPIKQIQGKYFTREKFCDIYAKVNKSFDYHTAWGGFNIPDNYVRKFFSIFKDLSLKEGYLRKIVSKYLNSNKKFYIIGYVEKDKDALNHELAHSKYYLNENYRKQMDSVIDGLPKKVFKSLSSSLIEMKYDKKVIRDEIQSYFSTSKKSELKLWFNKSIKKRFLKRFRQIYRDS